MMAIPNLPIPPAPPAPAPWDELEDEVAAAIDMSAPPPAPSVVPPPPPRAVSPAPSVAPPPPPRAVPPAPSMAPPPAPSVVPPPPPPAAQVQVPAAPLAPAPATPLAQVQTSDVSVQQMALEEGFEGLDFDGFGTFPIISLKRGSFKTSSGEDLGQSFNCVITSSRPKYLYKTKLPDNDPRSAVAYSYDQQTSNGKSIQDILANWAAQGIGYDMKKYLELTCTLEDGRLMLLSVPPTSISRFSAFTAARLMRGMKAPDTLVKVYIGQEVTRVAFPFTPIEFAIVD